MKGRISCNTCTQDTVQWEIFVRLRICEFTKGSPNFKSYVHINILCTRIGNACTCKSPIAFESCFAKFLLPANSSHYTVYSIITDHVHVHVCVCVCVALNGSTCVHVYISAYINTVP